MCREQWALTVIKLLRFFVLIFVVFLPVFIILLYHNGIVIQVSWKLWMFLICTPHKTRTFTVRLAVTTKYQGNGFAAEVLLGRDHPRIVTIGPIVRWVIAFPILKTWWDATTKVASQSVHLQASYGISNAFKQRPSNFKNFNIWSHDCHCGPNLLLHTKFNQNWFKRSASRRP